MRDARALTRIARACAALAIGMGLAVLIGWTTGLHTLTRLHHSLPAMVPDTALALVLAGLTVISGARPDRSRVEEIAALAAPFLLVLFGAATIVEYAAGIDLGFERLLGGAVAGADHPGRASPHTAVVFVLLGATLMTLRWRTGWRATVAGGLAWASAAAIGAAVMGYLLGEEHLRGLSKVTGMALHTVISLALLCVAAFCLRPDTAPTSWFVRAGAGYAAARRAMLPALLAPMASGAIVEVGVRRDWYGESLGVGLMVVLGVVAILGVVATAARTVAAYEAATEATESEARANRARFTTLTERAPLGIYEVDRAGALLFANDRWTEIAGMSRDQAVGMGWHAAIHPDDRDRVVAQARQAAATGVETASEYRFHHADGTDRWVTSYRSALRDDEGTVTGYLGSILDITDRHQGEQRLAEAEEELRLTFDLAPIGIALVDLDGRWLRVNRRLCEMTGWTESELLLRTSDDLTHPDDRAADSGLLRELLAGETRSYEAEKRLLRSDGSTVWMLLSVALVRDPDGEPLHLIEQFLDISERKRFERELRELADHDTLTGLLNRRSFGREVVRQLAQERRYGGSSALLLIDLDHFKYINDSLGHNCGDDVIRAVATALSDRLRETDMIARLGGDEFAVLMPSTTEHDAAAVAEQLLVTVRELRIGTAEHELHVTASIGVVSSGQLREADEEGLLAAADVAMYDAKDEGRNRFAVHAGTGEGTDRASDRLNWSHRIREALEHDDFVLHYQPILDLHTHEITNYEALLRMRGAGDTLVDPGTFLYIAERYGLMDAIDRWVVHAGIAALPEIPPDAGLSLNISARSLGSPRLLAVIEHELAADGVDPSRVTFEVTESAAISRVEDAREFGRVLAHLGCGLALDDFGTGFGSFFHLKHLPFGVIKIDGDFIRGITRTRSDRILVEALVAVARGTGKRTVAEYVGDEETLELLRDLGVDAAQGFYIGRPMPLDAQLSAPR